MAKRDSPSGTGRRRRQRGSISADEIVKGAFEVARGVSLDTLSMPNLAEHLDVGVTSIYWYFRKKEDLLNAMTDLAVDKYVGAMPPVTPGKPWQQALTDHFQAQRRIQGEDETLADLMLIRTSTYSRNATRRVFELMEAVVALLIEQGFTPDNAFRVYNTISVYTRGVVIHDRILRLSHAPTLDSHRQRRMTDWSSMPILETLIDKYTLAGTSDDDFVFGLGRLICGFERLLEEQGSSGGRRGRASSARTASRKPAAATR